MSEDKRTVHTKTVTPFNVDEISQLTGRSKNDLLRHYWKAKNRGYSLAVIVDEVDPELLGKCFYNYHWFDSKKLGKWVCMVHNQESKYKIAEGSRLPCLALDPTD